MWIEGRGACISAGFTASILIRRAVLGAGRGGGAGVVAGVGAGVEPGLGLVWSATLSLPQEDERVLVVPFDTDSAPRTLLALRGGALLMAG